MRDKQPELRSSVTQRHILHALGGLLLLVAVSLWPIVELGRVLEDLWIGDTAAAAEWWAAGWWLIPLFYLPVWLLCAGLFWRRPRRDSDAQHPHQER